MWLIALAHAARPPDFHPNTGGYAFDTFDGCFKSGLRLVVVRDTRQPVVTVQLVVDGGAAADPPGAEGTAHLLEHLAFRTRTGDGTTVRARLDGLGASWDAFTEADTTRFVTLAAADALPAILAIEGQRLVDPLSGVGAADVEAERVIVRNELQQNRIDRDGAVLAPLWGALYPPGHPYHAVQASSAASLAHLTLADLQAEARRWYTPAHTTLVVRGDVVGADVSDLALRMLPDPVVGVPTGSPAVACRSRLPQDAAPPTPAATTLTTATSTNESRWLALGWSLPGAWGPDDRVMDLALGVLEYQLQDYGTWALGLAPGEAKTVTAPSCGITRAARASTATCWLELTDDADPATVVERARHTARTLATTESLPDSWFRFIVAAEIVRVLRAEEEAATPASVQGALGALGAHLADDSLYAGTAIDRLTKMGPDEVVLFARRWFTAERMVPTLLQPAREGAAYTIEAQPVEVAVDARGADRALTVPAPALHHFTLDNGLDVVVLPYGDLPLVRVTLELGGGPLVEPQPGLDALFRGLETWEARNTLQDVDLGMLGIGGELTTDNDGLHEVHHLDAAAGNLDDLLYLLRLRLDGSIVDNDRRADFVERSAWRLHRARGAPEWWLDALVYGGLFGAHPLAAALDDNRIHDVWRFSVREVEAWRDRIRRPDNARLLVVGRVDPAAVEASVRDRLATWKARGAPTPFPPMPPVPAPPARQALFLPFPQASIGELRIGCQVDPGTPEALGVLARALDLEVRDAWRNRTAWAYDPAASVVHKGAAGIVTLSAHVPADHVGDAVAAGLELLARVGSGSYAGLARARGAWAHGYVLGQVRLADMSDRLAEAARNGDPGAWLAATPARLAAVDGAALAAALRPCIGHERIVAAGPEAVAATLGTGVERFDWQADRERRWAALDPDGAAKH